jgi:hypothetical protein
VKPSPSSIETIAQAQNGPFADNVLVTVTNPLGNPGEQTLHLMAHFEHENADGTADYVTPAFAVETHAVCVKPQLPYIKVAPKTTITASAGGKSQTPLLVLDREHPLPPFDPASTSDTFAALKQTYKTILELTGPSEGAPGLLPRAVRDVFTYRIRLIDRYLRISDLYKAKKLLLMPPPALRERANPSTSEITDAEIFAIANIYLGLLQERPPSVLDGKYSDRIQWQDTSGTPIEFNSLKEQAAVADAVSLCRVRELRTDTKATLMNGVEGTLGTLTLIPGGTIAQSVHDLVTGKSVTGASLTFFQRALAAADIGFQVAPIVIGYLRARAIKLPIESRNALLTYLSDRSNVTGYLQGARGAIGAEERIMTDWMNAYYKALGLEARSLPYARTAPLVPARGIDMRVLDWKPGRTLIDELKVVSDFDGNFAGDNPLRQNSVKIPGIAASRASQASWSWIVDRSMKCYKYGVTTGDTALVAEARQVLARFEAGLLDRRLIVMNDHGELFAAHESQLANLTSESASLEELRAAVAAWLRDHP